MYDIRSFLFEPLRQALDVSQGRQAFFADRLKRGKCLILLDGLDEAPDPAARGDLASLADNLATVYSKCPLVITSRLRG